MSRVVIAPWLLCSSPFQSTVAYLQQQPPAPPARPLLLALLRAAFALPSDAAAAAFCAALPLVELHAPTHLLSACSAFLVQLQWEGPAVRAALALLLGSESRDGLVLLVGLMAQASTSCSSRRRAAVCSILLRIALPPHWQAGGAQASQSLQQLAAALQPSSPAAAAAAPRLHAAAAAHVQDLKDRAFDSVFQQPSLLYAAAPGVAPRLDYVLLDAEVHGGPSLAALLTAATGIRTSRAPELQDEATGFADAVAAGGMQAQLQALWQLEHCGRSWASLKGCSGARPERVLGADVFCGWGGSRVEGGRVPTVRHFALQAVDPSPGNAVRRRVYARTYLAQYARYFEEGAVVPRLVAALMAACGEDLEQFLLGAESLLGGGVAAAAAAAAQAEEGGSVAGEWLYDTEAFPPQLRADRAWQLLKVLGIVERREGGGGEGGAEGAEDREWTCSACTLVNVAAALQCEACEAGRQ